MRLELSDGGLLDLSDNEARTLYETLLERARRRGARSAAGKLRPALTWASETGTTVALDQFETAAVLEAVREDD
jgi:hypothetical protein